MFAVVTDSTADIAPRMAEENGIEVVPLMVTFGEEAFTDGVLSQEQFFERMSTTPQLPTTSQPSVGAFVDAYERALERFSEVVSVHISSKLSGTMESARGAAERFEGRVHVVDSLNLSWALAWQVREAAAAAAEGLSATQALDRVHDVRDRVRMIVGVDKLENLQRGGRIGRVSAFLGSMLNLKVTFTVDANGEFQPVARSRGERAAMEHTLEWVAQQMGAARRGKFAVGHALSEPRAHTLADALRARWDVAEMVVYETGSVIATHTGTGWGVTVLPEN
jgi:DegV family protein with EDD domain